MGILIGMAGHQGGAGKTTTVLNLGVSLAQQGKKTLLIDTDPLGSLAPASSLTSSTEPGLVQMLRGQESTQVIKESSFGIPLSLLANGVQQPGDAFFLEKQAKKGGLGRLLDSLAQEYDYILIDTPSSIEAISSMVFAHCILGVYEKLAFHFLTEDLTMEEKTDMARDAVEFTVGGMQQITL